MNRRLSAVAVAVAVASALDVILGGCGGLGTGSEKPATANAGGDRPTPPEPSASAVSGLGAAEHEKDLPDPCGLLSRSEVTDLTGRDVTETDRDDAEPGDAARYCQWQQDGGQLALFLARTTDDEFHAAIAGAQPLAGVAGHDAFTLAGHLYVLDGGRQVDVYSRGGSDQQNLSDETEVVKTVLPRIE
jgi:Protein of unknown function (DUF3558)